MKPASSRTVLIIGLALLVNAVCLAEPPSSGSTPPTVALPAKLADLDLPLTVQDSAGVQRRGEICSTGVPVPQGLMQESEGIAVVDEKGTAIPAQFRVLERWRDFSQDKTVKWLLVTFFADVPKGGKAVYRLKAGVNAAPAKPVKIDEKPDAFELGGQVLKKDLSSPFKLVLTDPDGKELSAADVALFTSSPVQSSTSCCSS